jgi:CMP/dCMP kinase
MSNNICIAISGKSGCGNTTVSHKLGEILGFNVINYTFRALAKELGLEFKELCELAGKDSKYDRIIDRHQVELASQEDCVLGSRLAIWMKKDADLKIYLYATEKARAQRVHKREGGSIKQIMHDTAIRDERDTKRYMDLYGIDNNNYDFADLVINTEKFPGPEEEAKYIAEFVRKKLDI